MHKKQLNTIRIVARIIALLWGGTFAFIGIAWCINEPDGPKTFALIGLGLLVSAVIAYVYELLGGIILILEGSTIMIILSLLSRAQLGVHNSTFYIIPLMISFPALFSGVLFMIISRIKRTNAL